VAGTCEQGNGRLDSTKGGEILDPLWEYHVLKKHSDP
jgi:hypothetical protein